MTPENEETQGFADEVDAAIDNMILPEDNTFDDKVKEVLDDAGIFDLPVQNAGTCTPGAGLPAHNVPQLGDTWLVGGLSEESKPANYDELPDSDKEIIDGLRMELEADEPAEVPAASFDIFRAAYMAFHQSLIEKLDEMSDESMIKAYYQQYANNSKFSQFVTSTVEWANQQDVSDCALIPKKQPQGITEATAGEFSTNLEGLDADTEKRQLDVFDISKQVNMIPADRDDAGASLDRAELEKQWRESALEVERLQQQLARENEAPALWAAVAEFFNLVMLTEPEAEIDEPLVIRLQLFVDRIRNENWQFKNREKINDPYFYELPPMLADWLKGQPEDVMSLEPALKVSMMLGRLNRAALETSEDTALINELISVFSYRLPAENTKQALLDLMRLNGKDAAKYRDGVK